MRQFKLEEQKAIYKAIEIIETLAIKSDLVATSSVAVKQYCTLQLASSECEKFGILFLNTANKLIAFEVVSEGTLDSANVYPKECVKRALELNARSVVLTHNHPGQVNRPSMSDELVTSRLVDAFKLMDINVLDHIIVSCTGSYSFAENGKL